MHASGLMDSNLHALKFLAKVFSYQDSKFRTVLFSSVDVIMISSFMQTPYPFYSEGVLGAKFCKTNA
jgi:hypothetical protein